MNSLFSEISDEEFERIILQLYLYAKFKLRKYKGSRISSLVQYNDIANTAVMKTLSGDRPWNKKNSLFKHLTECVNSILSNTVTSHDVKICEGSTDNKSYSTSGSTEISIEQQVINSEQRAFKIQEIDIFINYVVEHKPELLKIIKAMYEDDIIKPRHLVNHLDMTLSEVNAKKLSVKRLIQKYKQKVGAK